MRVKKGWNEVTSFPRLRMVLVALALVPFGNDGHASDRVAVGSKPFTENRLLAEAMAQLIEARTDLDVERRFGLGGTTLAFSALRSGEIDMYPEYTGTGWIVMLGRTETAPDALRVYATVRSEFEKRFALTWLSPFGFENSYALAVRTQLADELGLQTISDLVAHQDQLSAGVSHEFLERQDGFPGLARAYGLQFGQVRGMEHGLAYQALSSGQIDVIDTWTTDGKLLRFDVRILIDDRGFFPPYDAAPVIRLDALQRHPELGPLLDELGFRLNDRRMRELNARVEETSGDIVTVAREFLSSEKLLGNSSASRPPPPARNVWAEIPTLAAEHLLLTFLAVLLAIAVALPLGIALTRTRWLAGPVLGAAGVLQTVPSLALLALMIPIPFLGLGMRSAIAALFLYALLPVLRNVYAGLRDVDEDLIEAATGMGLTRNQTLTRVQLPLAVPTIMAGVRTAAVISVGVATLAAFIGAGGLGEPIVTGLQLNDVRLIVSGAIPAALLALAVDFLLGRAEARLVRRRNAPPAMSVRS